MDQLARHSAAREMFMLEHTRWKDHLLLFLGIIGSVFIGQQYVKDVVSVSDVFWFSAFVSFLWLCAVLANRSSTFAWSKTLQEIENSPTTEPFRCYHKIRKEFSLWRDLGSHFCLVHQNGDSKLGFHIVDSVTRVYITLALAMMCAFGVLAFKTSNPSKPDVEAKLGRQLIERDIRGFSTDAKLIELFAPNAMISEYQAHILLTSEKHRIIAWQVDNVGKVVKGPYSP